ncbi:hypothetical protein JOF48_003585 [Arthrobacter stackebrandtii]|uniref:RNA-directed DNA polymerase n=1 Tax=Arthrobacter stackebrandtii TaxID=272161 RepID=A0ABS4Z1D6_9MICC|nr:reverse transcriptase family protein [Arthrobacter stackebrandtii]MBP2414786.1 hypothetical protein [Arthrobacter stackebrandtii]
MPDPCTAGAALRSAQLRTRTDSRVIGEAIAAMTAQPRARAAGRADPAVAPVTAASATLKRTPRPSPTAIAATLAQAFLSSPDWSKPALMESGAQVLGARRRWLGPLAAQVLRSHPRPPVDAPRELAALVLVSEPFVEALAKSVQQRKPIHLARYVLAAGAARDSQVRGAPRIDTVGALAARLGLGVGELDWFADPRHWNRRADARLQHYRYRWLVRPGRVPRLLEIPRPRLRFLQRAVLRELLHPLPLHDAAHGFVPGRSAVTGAAQHTGRAVVVNLDLASFFAHVTAGRVFGVLRQAGFTEAVAHQLTGLCTHVVPPRILVQMPPGGDPADRLALRQALSLPHLPQGAPTSPTLANLSLRRLDSRLAGLAEKFDGGYTRYADDLAFSGGRDMLRRADALVRAAGTIVEDEGHRLNRLKSRVRPAGTRQAVTSVVVNERTNLARDDFDRLKAIIHNCRVHGPESQNRDSVPEFRSHLLGRISWLSSLNPARGARLRQAFDLITW